MSQPTTLSPWYVVQKFNEDTGAHPSIEYYTSMELDEGTWQHEPSKAMIFMSLITASRVADEEGAEVRVLYNKAQAKEFDRYAEDVR